MVQSRQTLLEHSIDWRVADWRVLAEYMQGLSSGAEWLISRAVLPESALDGLGDALRSAHSPDPLQLSVEVETPNFGQLRSDLERFQRAVPNRYEIVGLETQWPADGREGIRGLRAFDGFDIFVDVSAASDAREALAILAETDSLMARWESNEHNAALIHDCLNLDLPFKILVADLRSTARLMALASITLAEDLSVQEAASLLEPSVEIEFMAGAVRMGGGEADLETIEDARALFIAVTASPSLDHVLRLAEVE